MAILNLFITTKVSEILGLCLIHLIWSFFLGYFEPMPQKGYLIYNIGRIVLIIAFWFLIPNEDRIVPIFRQKCKAFVCFYFWTFFTVVLMVVMTKMMRSVSQDNQWIIALILLLEKEICGWIANKIITKAAIKGNHDKAKYTAQIANNLGFSLAYAISFTSVTKTTEFLLLGIGFFMNMALVYKVVQLNGKVSTNGSESQQRNKMKEYAITDLILNEIVEIMVPTSFVISCYMGYYGPNKDTIGILGCTLWHQPNVENLIDFVSPVIEMALLDSCSLIVAGGILWWFCNINIVKECCKIIKKYWKDLAFHGASFLSAVSIIE